MNNTMADTFPMIAKTLFGLENVLAAELESLGAANVRIMNRSVEFTGDKRLLYKANLSCRCATRILKPIATFQAQNADELYGQIDDIDWSRFLGPDESLAVNAIISNTAFDHSLYVAQLTKDAICDQFRDRTGRRPWVNLDDPNLRINLYIDDSDVTLSLDASGQPLNRRGYRTQKGKAPISEVLAAGILALTGWDANSPFVDAMCGAGTFVIEAAMMARNIAPGLNRDHFAFQKWKDYDSRLLDHLKTEARLLVKSNLPFPIIGSDISGARIKEAKANARRAGVDNDIRFENKAFDRQDPPAGPGILVINPPYGQRLTPADINNLYRTIGDTLKQKYAGYNAFIFTGNAEAAKCVGLRTSQRIPLFNGPLECRLLKYEMYTGTRETKEKDNLS